MKSKQKQFLNELIEKQNEEDDGQENVDDQQENNKQESEKLEKQDNQKQESEELKQQEKKKKKVIFEEEEKLMNKQENKEKYQNLENYESDKLENKQQINEQEIMKQKEEIKQENKQLEHIIQEEKQYYQNEEIDKIQKQEMEEYYDEEDQMDESVKSQQDKLTQVLNNVQDFIPSIQNQQEEEKEVKVREQLPYLKDPKIKVSVWTIIKDSIGKDITKMSVPVYFNDPTSLLQRLCQQVEYSHYILTQALREPDHIRRLAIIAVYATTMFTNLERQSSKPFNPLLGETFEFVTDHFRYISEQVSHHPPVSAWHCYGFGGFQIWTNSGVKSKFKGKTMQFLNQFRHYIQLDHDRSPYQQESLINHPERFEIQQPMMVAHNLILGNMYIDLKGQSQVRSLNRPDQICTLQYSERGFSGGSAFKVEGMIKDQSNKVLYQIEGRWNSQTFIINKQTNQKDLIWEKSPYPDKWDYMYGMSKLSIQHNYFPSWLQKVVAPTDTRRRPDQRALENGDMKLATSEKNRLEEKQRIVRKYKEKMKIEHLPAYFEEQYNTEDKQNYWIYNKKYFEDERLTQKWNRLPDIYSNWLPEEILEFEKNQKK